MNLKEKLYEIITKLDNNRPVSIKNDKEMVTVKKHKKNKVVDVWLFYKIKDSFKELWHTTTSTDCTKGDINDIVEDMSLEIPKESQEQEQEQVVTKQDKNWYDGLNASEREVCLCKYAMMVYTLLDVFLEQGVVDDKELIDEYSYYGLEEEDLRQLGVIL